MNNVIPPLKYTILNKNTRLFVIERAIEIEDLISKTLASLLNIDLKFSKALGNDSVSFSFNSKVILINDIKNIQKKEKEKLELMAQIRNKFAHVISIDSFESLFNLNSNFKKKLLAYYLKDDKISDLNEISYLNYFENLFSDNLDFLFQITLNSEVDKAIDKTNLEFHEELIKLLKEKLIKSETTTEIWNSSIYQIIQNRKGKKDDK